jgi:hypothetical protein
MATDSWLDKRYQIWTTTDESSFPVPYAQMLVKIFRGFFADFSLIRQRFLGGSFPV